jgi:hypothetical protein
MSDQPRNAGQTRHDGMTVALVVVGIVLLLPGACSLFFAAQVIAEGDFIRLATRDPYFQMLLVLWAICLAIALGGTLLIRYALRRAHRRQELGG